MIIDELVCLRSKMYAFKCGDESKNKMRGFSESYSKIINFEEYKNCLDEENYEKECNVFILRSVNHEKYLQKNEKLTFSNFDDKRCFISNIKS